jgi:cysteinyl-tRNA synthetase
MMVLNSGYRNPLTFNDEVIGQAEKALERLASALKPAQSDAAGLSEDDRQAFSDQVKKTRTGFEESMDDDFNSAGALGHLFELVRAINQARASGAVSEDLSAAQDLLRELTSVLGLTFDGKSYSASQADAFVDLLLEVRARIREAKMWELSDLIRDQLAELGVNVEDAKGGSTWTWK